MLKGGKVVISCHTRQTNYFEQKINVENLGEVIVTNMGMREGTRGVYEQDNIKRGKTANLIKLLKCEKALGMNK